MIEKTKILKYDCIIIGAGCAGLSAAIYLKRGNINTLIIEKDCPGGILNKIKKIDNYPGYLGEDGSNLAYNMYSMVNELDIPIIKEEVINITKESEEYNIKTNIGEYYTSNIIIATGRIPRKLEIEDKLQNKNGISYCAVCDGILYKSKDVIVLGGGNSAMEACRYLKDIANKIYLINRSDKLRADKMYQDNIKNEKNIEILYNSKIKDVFYKDNELCGVILENDEKINASAIFVCIGQDLNNRFYSSLNIEQDDKGIIVDKNMKTNLDNIYAVGDSISKDLYQVVTAVSEGAIAASNIIKNK